MKFATKTIVALFVAAAAMTAADAFAGCGGGHGHSYRPSYRPSHHASYRPSYKAPSSYCPSRRPVNPPAVPQPQYYPPQGGQFAQEQPAPQQQFAGPQQPAPQQFGQQQPGPQQQLAGPQQPGPQQPGPQQPAPQQPANAQASALQALADMGAVPAAEAAPTQNAPPQPQQSGPVGQWTADLGNGVNVKLTLGGDGQFQWVATNQSGQTSTFDGSYAIGDDSLTLTRSNDNQKLAGQLTFNGANAFNFKLNGDENGLNFSRG